MDANGTAYAARRIKRRRFSSRARLRWLRHSNASMITLPLRTLLRTMHYRHNMTLSSAGDRLLALADLRGRLVYHGYHASYRC